MHELSIAESMMELIVESAATNGAERVTKVSIVIGGLADIVADSLKFCFDEIKRGSIADGAELIIEEVSAKAFCHDCQKEFEVGRFDFQCPDCGGVIIPAGGQELYIKEVEIE